MRATAPAQREGSRGRRACGVHVRSANQAGPCLYQALGTDPVSAETPEAARAAKTNMALALVAADEDACTLLEERVAARAATSATVRRGCSCCTGKNQQFHARAHLTCHCDTAGAHVASGWREKWICRVSNNYKASVGKHPVTFARTAATNMHAAQPSRGTPSGPPQ